MMWEGQMKSTDQVTNKTKQCILLSLSNVHKDNAPMNFNNLKNKFKSILLIITII